MKQEKEIMVGADAKRVDYKNTNFEKKIQVPMFVRDIWNSLHKYGMWITLAVGLGIYIGITVAGQFYSKKMDEITLVGGMVHKQKVFSVIPR